MIDKIFKIGILVLGALLLILYTHNSQNGRYRVFNENGILDTKAGTIYTVISGGEVKSFNLVQNKIETIKKLGDDYGKRHL